VCRCIHLGFSGDESALHGKVRGTAGRGGEDQDGAKPQDERKQHCPGGLELRDVLFFPIAETMRQ
jgi:hypothetical protein